ncbi:MULTISPECIES: glycosyltransferase [unclassified Breznakia]|uniref:glycosyltransferase n=1 Tax=unclassified Breznakia TaxID=2623764 RepID=UPI0024752EFA|nr:MULTISPECIES: glycosyltransferase [unclassified Breznakia]MDH6366291.1 glycosyltransferase involved in cell wall biosynthesis [Breznakia sp. PH1-1]MDH6403384.1 glycosyltransferase involved in cell wall biosynthesis [Breznakia sp. PF1-11]MDH6411093.1 glycosyltransferase involved in cell wall biosynthesis [Breznakia sp. PFB1-11]MDH6413457.1 glycosyltransferase involved in cell wall biosynthesis [Breznakia sp. PFB1-14]MDH6416754.1 glycosyltransferase involved in cell wall biosynthesis [Breznak
MKRALLYASVASMIKQFNMGNISILKSLGYKVDVACNFDFGNTISKQEIDNFKEILKQENIKYYNIPIPRKLSNLKQLKKSYNTTVKLLNSNNYDLVHCHSPIGGVICRQANYQSKNYKSCRMIYTAHGFHFFRGNNVIKNIIFKTIEKRYAKYTDELIVINHDDFEAAKMFKLKRNDSLHYVPGVGIDLNKIREVKGNKELLYRELGIDKKIRIILSVGELNDNKNHIAVIKALPNIPDCFHYVICGTGNLKQFLIDEAKKLNVDKRLHLLGYRDDIIKIMKCSDIFAFPSKREGLSVALMEALASGLPSYVTNIRGNRDLIYEGSNSFLLNLNDYSNQFQQIINSQEKIEKINDSLIKEMMCKYTSTSIDLLMRKIYMGGYSSE